VREVLSDLAATSSVSARVEGRALGVVLEVADAEVGRRSSELVSGMTRALGLPSAAPRPDGVQLVTRDATEPADLSRALSGLAGDGATILVAGLTDETAAAASLFAERTKTPVLLLRRPPALDPRSSFSFVLGVTPADEEAAIAAGLEREGARAPVRVGPGGVSCEVPDASTFGPRFPVNDWKRTGFDALVLTGGPTCARQAGLEALGSRLKVLLVFGLEASEASDALPGKKVVVAAGRFPFASHPNDPSESAYVQKWGAGPSWYGTLGHDAAVLGKEVLSTLPVERVKEERAVLELHKRARDGLLRARGQLWSTEAAGFEGHAVLPRTLSTARVSWGDSR
jgi:hypothetical protein